MADLHGPRLTATLALAPRQLEHHFWQSETYRTFASIIDVCSVSSGLLIAAAYLKWNARFTAAGHLARLLFGISFLVLWTLQALWIRLSKESYHRNRPYIILVQRSIRLAHFFTVPYYAHQQLATLTHPTDPALAHAFLASFSSPFSHPLLATAQLITMASSTMAALIPAILVPLPTRSQLLIQATYLLTLLTYCLAPSLYCLTTILPPAGPLQICTALNHCVHVTLSLFLGSTPAITHFDRFCTTPDTIVLLIVFVDLYAGFVLPVYFAYRLERYMKLLYLQREHGQRHWPPVPLLVDVLLLASLALLAWVLALLWHEPLARQWAGLPSAVGSCPAGALPGQCAAVA